MTGTEIAVLLPVRNAESTIGAALRSLQEQTLPNFRCIAIDDGSTDSSLDVMKATVHGDPRFELVRQ
jgi:glycosyltransferase involved in cell wall biosynthesis